MFIFDNFLFASFIPQILMFFGFVHMVVAPHLSSDKSESKEIEQQESVVVISEQSDASVAQFSDYFQTDKISHTDELKISFIQLLAIRLVTPHKLKYPVTGFYTALFSRPPPLIV